MPETASSLQEANTGGQVMFVDGYKFCYNRTLETTHTHTHTHTLTHTHTHTHLAHVMTDVISTH